MALLEIAASILYPLKSKKYLSVGRRSLLRVSSPKLERLRKQSSFEIILPIFRWRIFIWRWLMMYRWNKVFQLSKTMSKINFSFLNFRYKLKERPDPYFIVLACFVLSIISVFYYYYFRHPVPSLAHLTPKVGDH